MKLTNKSVVQSKNYKYLAKHSSEWKIYLKDDSAFHSSSSKAMLIDCTIPGLGIEKCYIKMWYWDVTTYRN